MTTEPGKTPGPASGEERPKGLPTRAQMLAWLIPIDFLLCAFVGYQLGKRLGAPWTGLILGMFTGSGLVAYEVWKAAKFGTDNDGK